MNKWDLTRIYPDEESFLRGLESLKLDIKEAESYKGRLGKKEDFRSYLLLSRKIQKNLSALFMYASMKSDLNKKDVRNNEDVARCRSVLNDLMAATSFEGPQIIALGRERVTSFIDGNPELEEFRFGFEKLFRSQEHVLDDASEKLMSYYGPLLSEGSSLYSMLTVGDGKPREAVLSDGRKVTVTQGNWRNLIMETAEPSDRQTIFEAVFDYYEEHKNVYGEIYNTVIQGELAEMKARRYGSILESHLFGNNIPTTVYGNLVRIARGHADPVKRYYKLRSEYLHLAKHRSYDRFLPLAKTGKRYSYEDAKKFFFASIEHFPLDFQTKAHEVLEEGYVDVYEQDGKRSGAYSTGGMGVHPYILLNFDNGLDDCFTVAHESGHSIHTLYAMENQPLMEQEYTIFVAEIASTFNEHNLLDYLMSSGKIDAEEKIMLLQKAIDDIIATFYRQTLFAEYELEISELAEKGKPINYDVCNGKMTGLYKDYYGIDITEEKVKSYVWAYIPHLFYTPFYVYQYATSFTASMKIYKDVKEKKPKAFERYIELLKSGGSAYPVDQVRKAGVDLASDEPFMAVIERMDELVSELESLLKDRQAA